MSVAQIVVDTKARRGECVLPHRSPAVTVAVPSSTQSARSERITRRPPMKRVFLKQTLAVLAFGLAAIVPAAQAQDKGSIGISMPTKSSARWISDGDSMVKELQGQGLQDRPAVRRGRHPEPAGADREHDHQGRQGAGDRGDRRHHAVQARCRRRPTRASRSSPTTA